MAEFADKVSPFLWFDGRALEAASFYVSTFKNARVTNVTQLGAGPAEGKDLVEFELEGLKFTAVDAGPEFSFSPAISFMVSCDSQEEIDHYWKALSAGGSMQQCGWSTDRFGITWQIVPAILPALMSKAPGEVMKALLPMEKLEIAKLREAAGLAGEDV